MKGSSERDVLEMNIERRGRYLEMISRERSVSGQGEVRGRTMNQSKRQKSEGRQPGMKEGTNWKKSEGL